MMKSKVENTESVLLTPWEKPYGAHGLNSTHKNALISLSGCIVVKTSKNDHIPVPIFFKFEFAKKYRPKIGNFLGNRIISRQNTLLFLVHK